MDISLSGGSVNTGDEMLMQRRVLLYGKIPQHGDFISRGFNPSQSRMWDEYLSEGLQQARLSLHDFDQLYGLTPFWRCVLEWEGTWFGGGLALSQDRVGRQFPILVLAECIDDEGAKTIAKHCEDCLYDGFGSRLSADELVHNLQIVPMTHINKQELTSEWWLDDIDNNLIAVLAGLHPPDLITQMMLSARRSL